MTIKITGYISAILAVALAYATLTDAWGVQGDNQIYILNLILVCWLVFIAINQIKLSNAFTDIAEKLKELTAVVKENRRLVEAQNILKNLNNIATGIEKAIEKAPVVVEMFGDEHGVYIEKGNLIRGGFPTKDEAAQWAEKNGYRVVTSFEADRGGMKTAADFKNEPDEKIKRGFTMLLIKGNLSIEDFRKMKVNQIKYKAI